jgi:hypothetical protein
MDGYAWSHVVGAGAILHYTETMARAPESPTSIPSPVISRRFSDSLPWLPITVSMPSIISFPRVSDANDISGATAINRWIGSATGRYSAVVRLEDLFILLAELLLAARDNATNSLALRLSKRMKLKNWNSRKLQKMNLKRKKSK